MPVAKGVRTYLVEGGSGTGKTFLCHALRRRGYRALNGDRDLIPDTRASQSGNTVLRDADARASWVQSQHAWDMGKVRAEIASRRDPVAFFCGGARNHADFIDLFDGVFVLEIDRATLERRLARRQGDEFGATPAERRLILRLHDTGRDLPPADRRNDATAPVADVVADILARCRERHPCRKRCGRRV